MHIFILGFESLLAVVLVHVVSGVNQDTNEMPGAFSDFARFVGFRGYDCIQVS